MLRTARLLALRQGQWYLEHAWRIDCHPGWYRSCFYEHLVAELGLSPS